MVVRAAVQLAAQANGHDLPGDPDRDERDVAANDYGITVAQDPDVDGSYMTCESQCILGFYAKLRQECCPLKGKTVLKKDDPLCCNKSR